MKRSETLKDTLSCRIHPELKEELSTEAYANGQTTSSYVEEILFNRNQPNLNLSQDQEHTNAFQDQAEEEYKELIKIYETKLETLEENHSNAIEKIEQFKLQHENFQEWKDYGKALETVNVELKQQLEKLAQKLDANQMELEELRQESTHLDEQPIENENQEVEKEFNLINWVPEIFLIVILIGGFIIWKNWGNIKSSPNQDNYIPPQPTNGHVVRNLY